MIVYLEGPDGSGKSTLGNEIAKSFPNVIYNAEPIISTHPLRPNRIKTVKLYNVLTAMANSEKLYVLDRGPISDIIYRLFDDEISVTTLSGILDFIITQMKAGNLVFIYCNCPNAKEAMLTRGDDNPVALKNHDVISRIYNKICNKIDNKFGIETCFSDNKFMYKSYTQRFDVEYWPYMVYNFITDDITDIIENIDSFMKAKLSCNCELLEREKLIRGE